MMLPSGNDAATLIAQNLGACLHFTQTGQHALLHELRSLDLCEDEASHGLYEGLFVREMNRLAYSLRLGNTTFHNPHGGALHQNTSTAKELCLLTAAAAQRPLFMTVAAARHHSCRGQYCPRFSKVLKSRVLYWLNTNDLLAHDACLAGKTGQTSSAGGCLATLFSTSRGPAVIVVLGCARDDRFRDTLQVFHAL
jgi:D-alanyl-D-alanine carboxypeptidase (penicillin-binding protein 5/6)